LSRDPIEESGGLNLYGFVGNAPIGLIDPFGLDWRVIRARGQKAAAVCDCGDTWDDLARKVRLDTSDYQIWAGTTDAQPEPGKTYFIPNTIIYEYGEYGIVPIITIWRQLASVDQNRFSNEGYNVITVDSTSSGQIKTHMKSHSLYGMTYIGHGDAEGGAVLDPSDLDFIKPGRYTAYGIAFLNLEACHSADTVTPKQGWTFNMWEFNVAKRGWFTGYEGEVDTYNEFGRWRSTRGKNRKD
jgi:hypothetical protein